jgi:hypothetical protein
VDPEARPAREEDISFVPTYEESEHEPPAPSFAEDAFEDRRDRAPRPPREEVEAPSHDDEESSDDGLE